MKIIGHLILLLLAAGSVPAGHAVEAGMCRLLSVSESEKLILISTIPDKTKYLLDAAAAKITIEGKPAEFKELTSFSIIRVKWNESNDKRNGIRLDGIAVEIEIDPPKNPQPQ
ncbi:MAG: hypothetical protein JW793_01015 [Acidobacteria bacterium]|nr:hypothetical protein [Acidobacteriota bacterium]